MKLHAIRIALLGAALLGLANLNGKAQLIPVFDTVTPTTGQTVRQHYQFTDLNLDTYSNYPSFASDPNAAGAWPSPIAANGGSLTLSLNKPSATDDSDFLPNSNGGGIYSFFTETVYSISNSAATANMSSLTFQIYQAQGSDGSATNGQVVGLPTLTLTFANSTTQILNSSAGVTSNPSSAVIFGADPTPLNDTTFTFDLSGVSQPIASYKLNVETGMHSILYGADVTEVAAVPEPSTWALMGLGMGVLFIFASARAGRN